MSGSAARTARQHAAQVRAAAEAAERRRRSRRRAVAVLAGLALLAVVAVVVQSSRTSAVEASAPPSGLVDGGIAVGAADAPVVVTLYEDPACPACAAWSSAAAPVLDPLVADGTVRLDIRPVAILDGVSPDRYSTRAVAAVGAVADLAPEAVPAYLHRLYAEQPREGAAGLSTERLADLAVAAGAPSSVRAAVLDQRFAGWAARATDDASRSGLRGTPTVLVDGDVLTERTAAGLRAAVSRAGGDR